MFIQRKTYIVQEYNKKNEALETSTKCLYCLMNFC